MKIMQIAQTLVLAACFVMLLSISNKINCPNPAIQPPQRDSLPLMRGGYVVDQVTFWNTAYGVGYNAGFIDGEKSARKN